MKCGVCKRKVKYTTEEDGVPYGGYVNGREDMCYDCFYEHTQIKRRHAEEIRQWRENQLNQSGSE